MHLFLSLTKKLLLMTFLFVSFTINSHAAFYLSGALKGGYQTNSTTDLSTVPETKMATFALDTGLGFRFYGVLLGVSGEVELIRQMTAPSKVSNINTQGILIAAYPMVGLDLGMFRLIGKFGSALTDKYQLDLLIPTLDKLSLLVCYFSVGYAAFFRLCFGLSKPRSSASKTEYTNASPVSSVI